MSEEQLRAISRSPAAAGTMPDGGFTGAAGGAACGDLVRVTVSLDRAGAAIADAGFDASGCGAAIAAGSATVALVAGAGSSTPRASDGARSTPSSGG